MHLRKVDAVAKKRESLLIQGRLYGPEYSATYMLDGRGNVVATALSRDHKSLYDGGEGPMTGGLGAFAPLSLDQANLGRRVKIEDFGLQIAEGLVEDGIDYRGTLYAGLMAETEDPDSELRVLEFNVRFGDPETQVVLPTLGGKAIEYMLAAAHGSLEMDLNRLYMIAGRELVTATVCLASPGYAEGEVVTGLPIHIPKDLPSDISIQFAGAKMLDGRPISSGGRGLYVTKTAPSLSEARSLYQYIGRENNGIYIGDDEQVIRTDIGLV
jgi:phosphoribosylamine-glycine ligase